MENQRRFELYHIVDEPDIFAICIDDGYNMFFSLDEIPDLIDLLTKMQHGQHDGERYSLSLDDRLMTVEEVAKTYNIQPGTVRRTIHKGWIKARKSGKTWLIKRSNAEMRWGDKV